MMFHMKFTQYRHILSAAVIFLLVLCLMTPASAQQPTAISLSFAGDCTLGGDESWMNYSIGTFRVMVEQQQDWGYFLQYAAEIFEQDDFTLVNLEGVLADSARGLNKTTKWNFRGATEYVNILTAGSVEGVTLGNNHSLDYGKVGLASTQATLDAAGITWAYNDTASFFEKDGIKIAFLGFWVSDFARARKGLAEQIRILKEQEGAHAVVLNYHGGQQYRQKHNKTQTEDMRFAIDAGADLVIGHHPHTLQGMEVYKERLIVYSLGNFCYGGNRKPRDLEYPSMILGAQLFFDEAGFAGTQLTIHPYRISGTHPRNNYQPHPVTGDLAQEVLAIIQADTPFELAPFVEGQGAVQEAVMVGRQP